MKILLLTLMLMISFSSQAAKNELVVFAHENGGYPADAMCFFSNSKMTVYGDGLLVHYMCFGKEDIYGEVWIVAATGNRLIARSEIGNLLTDAYLMDDKIYILEFQEMGTTAMYVSDVLHTQKFAIPDDFKNSYVHSVSRRGNEMIFRYTTSEREHGEGTFADGVFTKLPPRGVSFFHVPEANALMTIQKVSREDAEEIELRFAPEFAPFTVLKDRDADPSSPFKFFQNFMVLQNSDWAVMSSTDEGKVVILGHGKDYVVKNLSAHFKDVEVWPGAITQNGEFVLRATHLDGTRGLWILKDQPVLLFTSGEEVMVETVSVTVTKKSLFYNAPMINKNNELFIGVGLGDSEDGAVMGQGIVKIKL